MTLMKTYNLLLTAYLNICIDYLPGKRCSEYKLINIS